MSVSKITKRVRLTVVPFVRRLRAWMLYAQVQDDARRWARRRDVLERQLIEARLQAAFYGEWRAELMNELIPAPSRSDSPPNPCDQLGRSDGNNQNKEQTK